MLPEIVREPPLALGAPAEGSVEPFALSNSIEEARMVSAAALSPRISPAWRPRDPSEADPRTPLP